MSDGNICDVVLTFYKSLNRSNGYEFISNEYKSFNEPEYSPSKLT